MALAILSVVAIYTLDMYQSISSRKKLVDDQSRMEEITTALKAYFSGHESLPASIPFDALHPFGDPEYIPNIPIADLSLGQIYRFDTHGRPYLYFRAISPPPDNIPLAAGFKVDGKAAAGVVISFGENQTRDYVVVDTTVPPDGIDDIYTTNGDDILVAVEVNVEAVGIALAELETLGKRVEAYNREFAGIQEPHDPSVRPLNYYGDVAAGAPPIIDPDYYDQYVWIPNLDDDEDPYDRDPDSPDHPELYPYTPYYLANSGNPDFIQPNLHWPTTLPYGEGTFTSYDDEVYNLLPYFVDLVGYPDTHLVNLFTHPPGNWPGAEDPPPAYAVDILNEWYDDLYPNLNPNPPDVTNPSAKNLYFDDLDDPRLPPQGLKPEALDYTPDDGTRPVPPGYTDDDPDAVYDFFGVYPEPPLYLVDDDSTTVDERELPDLHSYELIDEGGCQLDGGIAPADPNCGYVYLDTNTYPDPPDASGNPVIDPVNFIYRRYGLGSIIETDPWGNRYQWRGGGNNTDPSYHLFYSLGPDGISGTNDDVLLF